MTTAFQEAAFIGRGGLSLLRRDAFTRDATSHQLVHRADSEDTASSARDWLEADTKKPCPHSCATRVNSFNVDGIPDARGVHRSQRPRTSDGRVENEVPNDSYWVGFTIGSIVYTVDLHGPPDPCRRSKSRKW